MTGKSSPQNKSERSRRYKADLFDLVNRKYDEGMSYREIADFLGITMSQVEAKIRGRPRNKIELG